MSTGTVLLAFAAVELGWTLHEQGYVALSAAILISGWCGGWPAALLAAALSLAVLTFNSLSFSAVGVASGVLLAAVGLAAVCEWQRAVAQLARAQTRFEAVLQRMPGGLIIAEVPSGKIELRSHESVLFPGSVPANVTEYAEHLPRLYDQFPPPEQWPLVQTLKTGEAVDRSELEFLARDGHRTTIRASSAPIRDAHARMIAVVSIFDDISDAKRAEETLRFLADASNALAVSLDYQTTLRRVTELAVPQLADWCMLHILPEDGSAPQMTVAHVDPAKAALIDQLYRDYPVPLDAAHGYPKVLRTGQSEFVSDIAPEWLLASAHDAVHLERLRALALRSMICVPLKSAGRTLGAMTLATGESGRRYDRDDLRLAEHFARRAGTAIDNARLYGKMAEADRRKNEFLATMAHELRNPLAPMRNALEIMRLRSDERTTLEAMRQMIDRQVTHMTRLIDDLLDLSRVTQGRIRLRHEVVDLNQVIDRAIEANRNLIDAKRHTFTRATPTQPLLIDGDAIRLEQIISNLVSNAVKYTDPGGTIVMNAECEDDQAVLRVRDSGCGIAPEMLPAVFDSFTRAAAFNDVDGGLGIGLTLVRSLVDMHGGSVTASSAGVGQGSEFVVRLPLSSSAESAPAPANTEIANPTPRLRVLVVDDNVNSADSLGLLLELWGHDVRVAYDGPGALDIASVLRPQVVLLDLGLPGLDGFQVAHELRQRADLGAVLLVAVTGHGQDDDRQRSKAAGFDHHLVKPVEPDALRRLFDQWATANAMVI